MDLMLIFVFLAVFAGALTNGVIGYLDAAAKGEKFIPAKFASSVFTALASSIIATGTLGLTGDRVTIPVLISAFATGYAIDAARNDIKDLTK